MLQLQLLEHVFLSSRESSPPTCFSRELYIKLTTIPPGTIAKFTITLIKQLHDQSTIFTISIIHMNSWQSCRMDLYRLQMSLSPTTMQTFPQMHCIQMKCLVSDLRIPVQLNSTDNINRTVNLSCREFTLLNLPYFVVLLIGIFQEVWFGQFFTWTFTESFLAQLLQCLFVNFLLIVANILFKG